MKIDRLIAILTVLLQENKTTAAKLAEKFEVSRRTILRDINSLSLAGIPIATQQGGDGGVYIMDGYKINKSVLNSDELSSLISALKGLDSVSKTSNFESLMNKLAPERNAMISLTNGVIIDLSSHYKDSLSEKIEPIKQAISDRQIITFDYYYSKGETHRIVEPYFIEFRWSTWYLLGWCRLRNDFRRFKLNRLWNLQITDESFSPKTVTDEKVNDADTFSEEYNIRLVFDKSMKFRLIEDYGLNCYEETENGLLLDLTYTNKDYIFNWILSFGDKAEIIEPLDIRNEFAGLVENLAKIYKRT